MMTEEAGRLLNTPALENTILCLHIKSRFIRKQMKQIWNNGNVERISEYVVLNDKLLKTNMIAAQLEHLKNRL